MKSGARIGLAVGAGYLLGRRRKLRKALVLAAAMAAGRASKESGGLLATGSRLLQSSPGLSKLGGPLAAASKAAATAAAGGGVDALSGKLRNTADSIRRRGGPQTDGATSDGATSDGATSDSDGASSDSDGASSGEGSSGEQPQANGGGR